ncbi:hypothetical protein [Bartonella sp. SD1336NMGDW]
MSKLDMAVVGRAVWLFVGCGRVWLFVGRAVWLVVEGVVGMACCKGQVLL